MKMGNPLVVDDGEVSILLSDGSVALIDAADLPLVAPHKWSAVCVSGRKSLPRFYVRARIAGRDVYLHKMLVSGVRVDHRDGDGRNNRRGNLRPCTHSQNSHNRPHQRNSKTGVKGVSFDAERSKYTACFVNQGVKIIHKWFDTLAEAEAAYKAAALATAGQFAYEAR